MSWVKGTVGRERGGRMGIRRGELDEANYSELSLHVFHVSGHAHGGRGRVSM